MVAAEAVGAAVADVAAVVARAEVAVLEWAAAAVHERVAAECLVPRRPADRPRSVVPRRRRARRAARGRP